MSREFTKHGTIKATDSDRRIASGVALVPHEVDHQGDWLTPSAVQRLADGYMRSLSSGQAEQGVMHVKFSAMDTAVAESRVLDEAEMIGDNEYPAGTWELGFKIFDDDLWNLVSGDEPVLAGFSIGGAIDTRDEESIDDLPEQVSIGEDVDLNGSGVTEIVDGDVREVSLVDLPAVPRARVTALKSLDDLEKAIEPSMTHDEIVEQLDGRGLDESQRSRLASYLKKSLGEAETAKVEGQNLPGGSMSACIDRLMEDGHDEEAAGAICGSLRSKEENEEDQSTMTEDDTGDEQHDKDESVELDEETKGLLKRLKEVFGGSTDDDDGNATVEKDGRTLSKENQEYLMAAHDSIEGALSNENADLRTNRYTDNDEYAFDLSEFEDGKDLGSPVLFSRAYAEFDGDADKLEKFMSDDNTADGDGETSVEELEAKFDTLLEKLDDEAEEVESESGEDDGEDPPKWAEALIDQQKTNADRIDDLVGEAAEEKSLEDAPEWAKELHDQGQKNADRIDAVAQGVGDTDQIGGTGESENGDENSLDDLAKALG